MSITFNHDQFVKGRPTKRLSVAALEPTQVYVDPSKVDRMAKVAGRDLPPALVGAGQIHDGHHRYAAAKRKGAKTLRAVVY